MASEALPDRIDDAGEERVPAQTVENYRLIYHSEVDGEVLTAWANRTPQDPQRQDQAERARRLRSTSFKNRPSQGVWPESRVKIGIMDQNIYLDTQGWGTNVPHPSNPGVKFDATSPSDIRTSGHGYETDVNISKVSYNGEVINPRLRYDGTSIVNHFSPVIRRPAPWLVKTIRTVAVPIALALKQLAEEEGNA